MKTKKKNLIGKKNLTSKKAFISYTQILIMLISIFAFCYIFYSGVYGVNAQSTGSTSTACCQKTKDGKSCQEDYETNCDPNYLKALTNCDNTNFCKKGCCYSSVTGLCNENSIKTDCNSSASVFLDNPNCVNQECKKGCCVLGNQARWTTERNCEVESGGQFGNVKKDFRPSVKSEVECIFLTEKNKQGACKNPNNRNCIYTTLEDCKTRIKNFNQYDFVPNTYCSDPIVNSTCVAMNHTGCLEGKEDVYYFDSCNNPENISKDCDILKGSYCGKQETDYVCKDVNCYINGAFRRNGESWCTYDDVIGNGKDPAGSRHVKHMCIMGEEKIEACSDYRNEICVQQDTSTSDGGILSQAACRANNWRGCIDYNALEGDVETSGSSQISGSSNYSGIAGIIYVPALPTTSGGSANTVKISKIKYMCEKNPDCWLKHIEMGSQFKFDVCLPQYPPGFNLQVPEQYAANPNYKSPGEAICNIASQQCTEVWLCGIFGCHCVVNCDCHKEKFTKDMNEFCVSLGDCGAYLNYKGDITFDGYSITSDGNRPPNVNEGMVLALKSKAGPKPAKPGDLKFFESLNPDISLAAGTTLENNILAGISGALGSPLLVKYLSQELTGNYTQNIENSINNIQTGSIDFSKYSNGFASIKDGTTVSYELKKILGLTSEQWIGGIIGGIIGGGLAYLISESIMAALGAALILFIIIILILGVTVKYVHINFKCHQWGAPAVTSDSMCDRCNQLDVPCTEYRCQSLGQTCELINKGTGRELCVNKPQNLTIPAIHPWIIDNILPTSGFSYLDITDKGFSLVNASTKGCIEAYTNVRFGIAITNTKGEKQYAQCKLDTDPTKKYNDMLDYFGDNGAILLPYHSMNYFMPSPDAYQNQYNLTDAQKKKLYSLKLYIKCKSNGIENPDPYQIDICVKPGPDLTPPRIQITDPPNGAYVKFNTSEVNLDVFVNEPSDCKWSKDGTKKYSDMENQMNCTKDLELYTPYGFPCSTKLTNIQNNSLFYIKCRDISPNNNTMQEPYQYSLTLSNNPLNIDEIYPKPGEQFLSGVEPFDVKLRLKTSGGAQGGIATCNWQAFKGESVYSDQFTQTNSNILEYDLNSVTNGNYIINFSCTDVAGNSATATTNFNAQTDTTGPKVIRIFFDGGLKIITSESGQCRFELNKALNFDNSTNMEGSGSEHTSEWFMKNYQIQCKDQYDNKGDLIYIRPYTPSY